MNKILLLGLMPLFIYAGSANAVLTCKSGSGRTLLKFYDQDLTGSFLGGQLSIDKKILKYENEDTKGVHAAMVVDLQRGVYTLNYQAENKTLIFYAIPKSVKRVGSRKYGAEHYKFTGLIGYRTADPRKVNGEMINKTISLSCTLDYSI